MKKPIVCADVIAKYADKFVIVERLNNPSGLAIVGGKKEKEEFLSETAVREFNEETGLSLALEGVLGTFAEDGRDPRGRFVSTVFVGAASGTGVDEKGKTKVHYLSKDEIFRLKDKFLFDHFKILLEYFEKQGGVK